MARMLYSSDSARFMLNVARRHQRLCRKSQNTESLINAIQPKVIALKEKMDALDLAQKSRQDAHDDVIFLDSDLDNSIRDLFDGCKGYDRNNPGANILNTVFTDGTFSGIIRMPYADEPGEAEKIALKVESLGSAHQLYPLASKLRGVIEKVRQGLNALSTAIRNEKAVEAETEIAKMELLRAFEINYLEARKNFGSKMADRLFPLLGSVNNEPAQEKD